MVIRPIAHIRTAFAEKFGVPRQSGLAKSLIGEIVFEKEFRNPDALRGLEGFSHLWLIWVQSSGRLCPSFTKSDLKSRTIPLTSNCHTDYYIYTTTLCQVLISCLTQNFTFSLNVTKHRTIFIVRCADILKIKVLRQT